MQTNAKKTRQQMLSLLDKTHHETRAMLSNLDPDRVIHTDEYAWRVRDILGHLGAWNMEAAHSLLAYAKGDEYCCIFSEAEYDDYNGPAAELRKAWALEQVWTEYENAHDKLRQIVASLPDEKWDGDVLYPWNLHGTVEHFIKVMMCHESGNHCALVMKATT
ncbi:MAG: hypothetical protein C3F13_16245 [Anaerolineales bacterium]|nr:MAG: hypothetical protein C3F13_16245 [Anaerolineales bacterium]